MKNEALFEELLVFDIRCRTFIQNLWNNSKATFYLGQYFRNFPIGEKFLDLPEKMLKKKYENNQIIYYRNFIVGLSKHKIIELCGWGLSSNEHNQSYMIVETELIDKKKLIPYLILFSNSTVEEPLGMHLQIRTLKEVLKNKFIKFENRNLKIKWKDIPFKKQPHFEIIKSLIELENQNYISVNISDVNICPEEMVEDFNGNLTEFPTDYGKINFSAKVEILDKLFVEWAQSSLININDINFDINSGKLYINNTVVNFCSPDTIEANLFDLLVKNLNYRVSHKELAKVTWNMDEQEIENEYQKTGKIALHHRNKIRINDLRKKIASHNLNSSLKIEPDKGYKLIYTRSGLDEESLANELRMADVPF